MVVSVVVASATNDVLRVLAVALQLIGIASLLLGVAEVRSWLDHTADASHAVGRSLARRLELEIENVRHWYATRRGRPFHMARRADDTIRISDSVSAAVTRAGAHPDGLSDHERLIRVETRAYGVQLQVDQLQQEHAEDQRKLEQRWAQLRAELREATRAGWQLITLGLVASAIGIVLGAFA
jgi:hypothetical protein